jgi:hypothetical protein
MTIERANPFASIDDPPVFATKPRKDNAVAKETIERLSEDNNFPSRQAARPPKEPTRKRRIYRTGRNRQLSIKATDATVERFYRLADERQLQLGALLDQALDALERAGGSQ